MRNFREKGIKVKATDQLKTIDEKIIENRKQSKLFKHEVSLR